ncbi:hypothetical protein TNCV_133821 [Trichonephila clavipes]|nr:hypothetical protein TNCV_133821 [Trichonephila clavipes]
MSRRKQPHPLHLDTLDQLSSLLEHGLMNFGKVTKRHKSLPLCLDDLAANALLSDATRRLAACPTCYKIPLST